MQFTQGMEVEGGDVQKGGDDVHKGGDVWKELMKSG